jgi:hypothetical protein
MRVLPPLCRPQATDGTASFPQHREFYRPWIGVQRAASFMGRLATSSGAFAGLMAVESIAGTEADDLLHGRQRPDLSGFIRPRH